MKIAVNSETRVAKFIAKRVYELQSRKSQKEIATEAGFATPNMVSMLKTGMTKLPLDRVGAVARALECDPRYLFRLAMEQFFNGETLKVIDEIIGTVVSQNELEILQVIRAASDNTDPALSDASREALAKLFAA